jgi:hemerythrin HHE cation binding domain-containing protein
VFCLAAGMAETFESAVTMDDLRRGLNAEHHAIEAACARALQALREGDRLTRESAWLALDARLRAHMTFEEQHVLPELERVDPREAHALAAEHCHIRALLSELDIDMELSRGCESMLADLSEQLHAHIARENTLLYRWCDESLSPAAREALRGRLARTLSQLAGERPPATQS